MSLLKLSGIGKIYYSEGSVAVGIRGVDLAFERGEFVAITGASGSGKSTLLNVISGMDSYEEGELYIEGSPTSHYLEPDWEEYRSKYISFIFQDYNILESYTVLQNVELALMHIKDRRERRRRAVELLTRVGMEKHLRQKGSKLSGGQKQRTVIARALAKDSPIILADEPTGNLDEATSKEIINLLREVSKDKLLIIVTHNYEEVEHCATRHIRIFDGSVEFDRGSKPSEISAREDKKFDYVPAKKKKFDLKEFLADLKDGIGLGGHVFASRPKLAVFTCLLMAVGMLGVFLMTSICFDREIVDEISSNMFEYRKGRVVVVRRDGDIPTIDEIRALAEEYGAKSSVECDYLIDTPIGVSLDYMPYRYYYSMGSSGTFLYPVSEYEGTFEGTLPDEDGEILLRLPISEKEEYADAILGETVVYCDDVSFVLTGISYYYDNNLPAAAYVTDEDYMLMARILAFMNSSSSVMLNAASLGGSMFSIHDFSICRELGDKFYFSKSFGYDMPFSEDMTIGIVGITSELLTIEAKNMATKLPDEIADYDGYSVAFVGIDVIEKLARIYTDNDYCQFSLFFENDIEARRAAKKLFGEGYIAVLSNATFEPEPFEKFAKTFIVFLMVSIWLGGIISLAFFIRLCQSRSIVSFKNDIAIMRSMGIKTSVIKISMYMRSVIALIPATGALFGVAALIFTSPKWNGFFNYLYGWQYALICAGLLLIAIRVSFKQQSKLFAGSVKKTLTGGELND